MARDYIIKDKVADGDFLSQAMTSNHTAMLLTSIRFFSDENYENQVQPTGGVVEIQLSEDGVNFLTVPNGRFSAIDTYNPDRTMPNAYGEANFAKITLEGVQGASHFKANIFRTTY